MFINESEMRTVAHDKEKGKVYYMDKGGEVRSVYGVNSVYYISNTSDEKYRSPGHEIEELELKLQLEEAQREKLSILFTEFRNRAYNLEKFVLAFEGPMSEEQKERLNKILEGSDGFSERVNELQEKQKQIEEQLKRYGNNDNDK